MTDTEGREDPDAPTAPEETAPEETRSARGGGSRPLIVVASALLVVATFLGVLAARYKAELDRERDERQQVEQVAARFSEAFFTYDYRNLKAGLDRITRDSTPKYAREFSQLYNTSISTLLTATKARSVGTITDVFVGPIDDETASAMTVANVAREGIAGRLPLAGQYLQLDLVKQGATWRVDNVLAVDLTQTNRSAPAATTTTSVPK